jgi:hypothetical protein
MSKLDWKEFMARHWEANTDAARLHVYRDSRDSFWSVHIGSLFIQDRTPMPFEAAKDAAEDVAENWIECNKAWQERDGYLETIRETFRVLDARGQAPDDNAPLSVTVRRVLDYLDKVTAQRDALKKRVADAPRKMLYPRDESEKTKWIAVLDLEEGE